MHKYLAIVGARCPDSAIERLLSLPEVCDAVKLPCDNQIAEPIADHPDSLICIFEGKLYVHSQYAKTAEKELSHTIKACSLEIFPVDCERAPLYPLDCGFNALSLPDRHLLIGRKESLAEPLKSFVLGNTNQGYAGCTALYVAGTVVTADPSIEKAAQSLGVPVFKISGKDISLRGYKEGFIGGAGGAFENTVCLFGSPSFSQSGKEVAEFCKNHSLKLIPLENGVLTDRGGVKFVEVSE